MVWLVLRFIRPRFHGVSGIRETPRLIVIRVELHHPFCLPEPQFRPRLGDSLDASPEQDRDRLRLFERINRIVADPEELQIRFAEAEPDHPVERRLHPRFQRHQPFRRRLRAASARWRD